MGKGDWLSEEVAIVAVVARVGILRLEMRVFGEDWRCIKNNLKAIKVLICVLKIKVS